MSIRSLQTSTLTSQTRYANMSAFYGTQYPVQADFLVVAGGGGAGMAVKGAAKLAGKEDKVYKYLNFNEIENYALEERTTAENKYGITVKPV